MLLTEKCTKSNLKQRLVVLATQDLRSQKRCLKGVVVVVKQALFERMAHVASTTEWNRTGS